MRAAVAGGLAATHKRWHVARSQPNPLCPLCRGDRRRARQPSSQRRIVLAASDADALLQLVRRIEGVDPRADDLFVARVAMLTEFLHDVLGE